MRKPSSSWAPGTGADIGVPRNYVAAYKWFDIAARWHRSRQLYAPVSGA